MGIGFAFFFALLLLDIALGEFRKPRALSMNELGVSIAAMLLAFTVRALPFALIMFVMKHFFPALKNCFEGSSVLLAATLAMLLDDYGNYWLHRLAHKHRVLWQLHKPHHIPVHMNVVMGVRENMFYYFLLPVNLMAPVLVFTGQETAGAIAVGIKLLVVYLQHTGTRWDLWLRRCAAGRALLNLAERLFALQDFHHRHHGIGRFGNANSNYGNVLCIWDRLHGTHSGMPGRAQDAFGLPLGVKVESMTVQLFWPLFSDRDKVALPAAPLVQSTPEELLAAKAIIRTPDGVRIAVK
ncbi:MAG: sterol desaturase family protein [Pseudomonadota bacterium]